jgi:hypothetical protein
MIPRGQCGQGIWPFFYVKNPDYGIQAARATLSRFWEKVRFLKKKYKLVQIPTLI